MKDYLIGIDCGSTTVKCVVLDSESGEILYKKYKRHHSKVKEEVVSQLAEIKDIVRNGTVRAAISGSAGLGLAESAGLPFVQEVFATKAACDELLPGLDAVLELGGEDAKILFLTGGSEERMNGSCAGGTGAFIDQMASLLDVTVTELDQLYEGHKHIYNIASRCGVFAKSDIQPLLNQGARKEDISASIYQAIVGQTISGLAQGRQLVGKIAFLGGPLTFLNGLRDRFVKTLKLNENEAVFPENAEYFVAMGAAYLARKSEYTDYNTVAPAIARVRRSNIGGSLPSLFKSMEEYREFAERHERDSVEELDMESYSGDVWLGIDAGSTTTKLTLISDDDRILYSYYAPSKGDPITTIKGQLIKIYDKMGDRIRIAGSAVTGYGEELLKNAFDIDVGIVETVAHLHAAQHFCPDVDFIVDVGGQDMKCFKLKDGTIDSIMLNEACSSGCGSFIETFARALGYNAQEFATLGLFAEHCVNLGSRCTVFMNSSVKQAQKDGATVEDISAGLSVSVVKNALYKVIRARSPQDIGEHIVVQGGTFLNDAILRAFEMETGRDVIRPTIAGLMGAYGAALYVKKLGVSRSTIISKEKLEQFTHTSKASRCKGCENNCRITINSFGDRKYISGNKCDKMTRGANTEELPNCYRYKRELLFDGESRNINTGRPIGLPMGLNMYENLPFWRAILEEMGFYAVTSGKSTRELYIEGQHTIPSDTVCYPAKLMHGHVERLVHMGVKDIFYPCMPYNFDEKLGDNNYNCPVVAYYPELIAANVGELSSVSFHMPYFGPHRKRYFTKRVADYFEEKFGIAKGVAKRAVQAGFEAYARYKEKVFAYGDEAIRFARETGRQLIILAGRPYHVDEEINHGIDKLLEMLNCVVISEDAIRPGGGTKPKVLNQWTYHARLYEAARYAVEHDDTDLVQLVSFGCGLDAVTTDQVKDILQGGNKLYTQIKIDEISNLGAVKIRLRSLIAAEEIKRNTQYGTAKG